VRVALVTNIVPPYRLPVFRRLAETPGWRLRVFTSARTEFDRSWSVDTGGLDVVRVCGLSRVWRGRTLHVPLALPLALLRFRPDVVVSGELGARSWLALLYCRLAGVPLVVWAYPSRVAGRRARGLLLHLRRALLARAAAVIGMGAQAREALAAWGVPQDAIHDAPNAHDADGLRKALAAVDPEAARLGLAGLGCRERVALFVGRLVASKGVAELLDAWDELEPGLREGWTLLLLGSGPLEERVRHAVRTHRRGEIAHARAVEPAEVAAFYAAAELLVLPSLEEPWGLVANEAMASGLPVCASRLAGCADDLLQEGRTGWVFDPRVPADFAAALRRALGSPDRERMRAQSRRRAARFGPDAMAEGMRRAILRAAAAWRPGPAPRAARPRGRLSLRSAAREAATAASVLSRRVARGRWDDVAPALRALGSLGRELANAVTRASSARECPICGWSGPGFGPQYFAERFRERCRCYGCGSKERARFAARYLASELAGFFAAGRRRVLDVGPEPYSRRLFPGDVDYVSFDLRSPLAMLRGDLAHAPFDDGCFDLWFCFHVVDQIPDDRAAMRELFRLLAPGGIGLFGATVDWKAPTRELPSGEARFGPLRRYGHDVVGRLQAAGFEVAKADPAQHLSPAEIGRFGLGRDPFLVCRRPT
jgi:glycosyltransferase involved in cell wall biosynthesis